MNKTRIADNFRTNFFFSVIFWGFRGDFGPKWSLPPPTPPSPASMSKFPSEGNHYSEWVWLAAVTPQQSWMIFLNTSAILFYPQIIDNHHNQLVLCVKATLRFCHSQVLRADLYLFLLMNQRIWLCPASPCQILDNSG